MSIFKNSIVFGDPDKYSYSWVIEPEFYGESGTMTLHGGALRYDERSRTHTVYFKFDEFVDDEHDHCTAASLEFVNLNPVYGYGSLRFEGLLIRGSWYKNAITGVDDLKAQIKPGRAADVEECADEDGKCYYGRTDLGLHYCGAPYTPPVHTFEPTPMGLSYNLTKERDE
jgi:hypothetical protein